MIQNKTTLAILFTLMACLIWAGNFVIARGVHDQIAPFTLSFWRWAVALVAILPFSYLALRREWHIVMANLKYLVPMAVIGVAGFNSLIYFAAHTTTTSHISIISSTTPIFTIFLASVVGEERLALPKILGALLACLGALTIINHGDLQVLLQQKWVLGDLLVVVSSFVWAIWSVGLRFKPKGLSSYVFMSAVVAIGLITLTPFYIWEAQTHQIDLLSLKNWSIFVYIGVAGSIVAWLLWQYSVENIGSVKTSLIYYSLPVFSSVLAIYTLGETLQLYHFLGFGLVFLGILVALFFRKKTV